MAAKKSYSTRKKIVQDLAAELHAKLLQSVGDLVTSEGWPKLLAAMTSKNGTEIGRYSFGNMLLIWMQCPEATAVCSFNAWKERGRSVVKGAKSLRINAPVTVRDKDKDKDGEEKTFVAFRMIPVFDVSQTEPTWQDPHGMTITPSLTHPAHAIRLQGDAPAALQKAVTGCIQEMGYTVEIQHTGSANGLTDPKTKRVLVSETASQAQQAKTLAHELGHLLLGHTEDMAEYHQHRGSAETAAESFAYMVCTHYGLDSATYSAPYIGSWAGKDPEEILKAVQETGDKVLKAFRGFLLDQEASADEKISAEQGALL